VYQFTIKTLDTLPLPMPGAIQSRDLSPLAIGRVRAKQTLDHMVRTLLARLVPLGIRMKLVYRITG